MAINFFQKIFDLISKKTIKDLPIKFEIEQLENGNHLVKIFAKIGEEWIQIKNPQQLKRYGYSIERDGITYFLTLESQQIVHSLFSLNPRILPGGSLEFEVTPSILRYLREKENVKEGEKSKKIKIFEKGVLKPKAEITYSPEKGLEIKAGYQVGEDKKLLFLHQFQKTKEEDYFKYGNDFYFRPKVSNSAKEFLTKETILIPPEKIPEFFKKDLIILKSQFNAVLSEDVKKIKIVEEPWTPKITLSHSKRGWLEFNISYKIGNYSLPHDVLMKKGSYYRYDRYTWIRTDKKIIGKVEEKLKEMGAEVEKENFKLPIYQFENLQEFIESVGGEKEISAEFQRFLNKITGFKEDENFDVGEEIRERLKEKEIELRPYQKSGIHWLNWLREMGLHGILADDMGLGKTIQTLCAIKLGYLYENPNIHSLVICPKPVMAHWKSEAEKVGLNAVIYHGANRYKTLAKLTSPHLIISTYSTVCNDIEYFQKIPFFFLVADEATNIKNPWTQRAKALKLLNALHRIAITGTPIENRLGEMWSIFDFIMKGFLGKYEEFERKYEIPISEKNEMVKEKLIGKIRPFIRRKLKKEVEKFLPEKVIEKEWCELTEEQKSLYGQIIERHKEIREALKRGEKLNYTASILPVLIKLKQVCDHPMLVSKDKDGKIEGRSEKFDRFLEKIEEIVESGQKAVLFSQYLQPLSLFEICLRKREIPYLRLDGSTPNPQEIISEFNEGKPQVILCSLRASSHGINLTGASHVLHFDRWWNPAVEDQATDRAHRLGQLHKHLFIHYILTKGTLEEKIDKLLQEKRQLFEEIIGAPIMGKREFTREELIEILSPLEK